MCKIGNSSLFLLPLKKKGLHDFFIFIIILEISLILPFRQLLPPVDMLAESILTSIAYKDEQYKSPKCRVLKKAGEEPWQDKLGNAAVNRDFHLESGTPAAEKIAVTCCETKTDEEVHLRNVAPKSLTKESNDFPYPGALSSPLSIPRREQHCEKELDLYRSWSCQSLYQNYPDLHIGGDHVADHACDSGCVMDQSQEEQIDGPVLLLEDVPLGHSPQTEFLQKPKAVKLWNGDDAGDRSMTLHRQPLSNSVINNYMEIKVQELYKQVLEEKLTTCNSITHILTSNLLVNNFSEVSLHMSHEPHLCGLQNTSSEFSTPNLQISTLLCKAKSSALQHAS